MALNCFYSIWRASWKTGRLVWCLLTYLLLTLYVETRRSLGMNFFCAKLARECDVIHVQLFLGRWLLILVHKEACTVRRNFKEEKGGHNFLLSSVSLLDGQVGKSPKSDTEIETKKRGDTKRNRVRSRAGKSIFTSPSFFSSSGFYYRGRKESRSVMSTDDTTET